MKKIYLITFLLSSVFMFSQKKHYSEMISEGTYTVKEIQDAAEGYFENRDKGKGTGYKQYKRWEYQALRSMQDNGVLKSTSFYYNELERYSKYRNENATNARNASPDTGNWEELGPYSKNASSSSSAGTGRVMAMAVEKNNVNHILVGSETGGVWKSINAGTTWTPLSDNLANMRVNSLAIDPTNSSIYFWGSNDGTIFKSTDAGATWNILATVGSGLVNKILIDPSNTTKLYCSVENSGIYKSIDSGSTWTLISSLLDSGYDVDFKPLDPSVVYASGNVFLRSTDGGVTFTNMVSAGLPIYTTEYVSGTLNWKSTNQGSTDFGVTPITPKTGARMGLFYKGTNGASGNKTKIVTPVLNLNAATNAVVKFSYTQPNYAPDVDVLKVYYKTSATGAWVQLADYTVAQETWLDVTLNLPNPTANYYVAFEGEIHGPGSGGGVTLDDVSIEATNLGVVFTDGFESPSTNTFSDGAKMIAVSESDPTVVYIAEASEPSTQSSYFGALYKSTDSGANSIKIPHTTNFFSLTTSGSGTGGQAPFHMDVAVSQTNANIVFLGGGNTWRSTDGGANFSLASHWVDYTATSNNVGYTHADICIMEGVGSKIYVGSDGGFFVAKTPSTAMSTSFYTDMSTGLGIRQFYKFGISQTNPVVITGGSQDNGSSAFTASEEWYDWVGADGGEGFVDKNNSNLIYGSQQYGDFARTSDVVNGSVSNVGSTPDGDGNFITPMEQDPTIANTFYTGYKHVYKTANNGTNWIAISQAFPGNIGEFKIAQSNNLILYASYLDKLYKTTTGSGTWAELTSYTGGYINSIAIHPTNPNKVAIATRGSGKVFISSNGGGTWVESKFDLPNFSALALVWDNNTNDGVYVGMDYGVYYTDNTLTNTWIPFVNNLPNVKISELEVNYADNKLYVATYGRGIWRTPRYDINTLSTGTTVLVEGISMYPNPATQSFSLVSAKNETATIRVFNALGKLMHYSKDVNLIKELKIDISQYATGLYFVRINNEKGSITKKLIVN